MRVSRIITVAIVLFAFAAAGGNAAAQQCPKGKLRLYTSWPMQGAMLPEGTGMKNGVDLAVSEVNGTVAGYCLEVVNLDDASPQTGKWDGAVEAENANKAIGDPLAIVYIGTYNSGAAKVSIPINNRAHMAQITPANTYPGLTKKQGAAPGEPEIYRPLGFVNYFRPVPADDIQGAVGAKWAKRLGAKKVYVLNDQELYGKGIADVFEEELLKGATCEVAMATEMRVTFAGLPFEKMKGIGAKTYEEYKKRFGKEPTAYALYAAEGGRVAVDAIKRAAAEMDRAKDITEKREALRKAISTT